MIKVDNKRHEVEIEGTGKDLDLEVGVIIAEIYGEIAKHVGKEFALKKLDSTIKVAKLAIEYKLNEDNKSVEEKYDKLFKEIFKGVFKDEN